MSTQPVTTTPMKGSRNPKRQQKRNNTPASQAKTVMLSTPPSSPPLIASPNDYFATGTPGVYNGEHNGSRKKTDNRSGKKPRENTRPANPAYNNSVNHRHTSSQPSIASPPQLKDSPHYAGPTFHASPAPSALPMPSFFSKSVPDSGLSTSLELDDELDEESAPELTPSKPKSSVSRINHEPSPLDFLFKAAIDARVKSQQSPEAVSKSTVSSSTDVSTTSQRQESSVNGIFSLELDGSDRNTPTYSTPISSYKQKMNALTSSDTQQRPATDLDDTQRKIKTEELKHLLLNPRPQRPVSASPHPKGLAQGYFPNGGLGYVTNVQQHANSGPPTPVSFNSHVQQPTGRPSNSYRSSPQAYAENANPFMFHRDASPYASPVNTARPNQYGPPFPSPYRNPQPSQRYHSPSPFTARLQSTPPSRQAEPDTKKMEDDLRRILKLDMTPSMQPNGVQSSLA
ncbi:hypothetical protein TMatcc_007777 [Talaromyces marneffei ATCC 18224]|uniref:Proteophosphoglycan 5 n=1 Tax=Talaromyces marneffei (strain ATCC 18224 / CBS 334.59 / QM 7333) TaxID=441960 RepID=B6QGU5_TALMQ|nr:conserved hypothetical protein [Talaromyces marneffei ATCC 18224]KAE8552834.1 hypothetical protein EYB25_004213 [Talaromyces marneffei]